MMLKSATLLLIVVWFTLFLVLWENSHALDQSFCPACPPRKQDTNADSIALVREVNRGVARSFVVHFSPEGTQNTALVYFYFPGDPSCEEVNKLLARLLLEQHIMYVLRKDISTDEGKYLKRLLNMYYQIPQERELFVPCIFIGDVVLCGEEEILAKLPILWEKWSQEEGKPRE
jgi:hypothetical protein